MVAKVGVGKGRPTERKRFLARIAAASEGGMPISPSDLAHPYAFDPPEEEGVDAKFARISDGIASRLGNALSAARSDGDSLVGSSEAVSALRGWPDDELPESVVFTCEARIFANDRVVSAIVSELVEHLVIGEELRSQLSVARRRCVEELAMTPPPMADFVSRLTACGVTARQVRYMSRERMTKVVSAIWDVSEIEAAAMMDDPGMAALWDVGVGGSPMVRDGIAGDRPGRGSGGSEGLSREDGGDGRDVSVGVSDDVSGDSETGTVGRGSDVVGAGDSLGSGPGVIDDSEGVSPDGPEPVSDGAEGGVVADAGGSVEVMDASFPDGDGMMVGEVDGVSSGGDVSSSADGAPGMADASATTGLGEPVHPGSGRSVTTGAVGAWDELDVSATGYVVEERTMVSDEDGSSRSLRIPDARTMAEMAPPNSVEFSVAKGADDQYDAVLARKFVLRFSVRTKLSLTEEEVRLWVFLLHEAKAVNPSRMVGGGGFFDGVRLPPAPGSAKARRLVWPDRDDLGRSATPAQLGRIAV